MAPTAASTNVDVSVEVQHNLDEISDYIMKLKMQIPTQ